MCVCTGTSETEIHKLEKISLTENRVESETKHHHAQPSPAQLTKEQKIYSINKL